MQFGALTLAQWAAALSPAENPAPAAPKPPTDAASENVSEESGKNEPAKDESPTPDGLGAKVPTEVRPKEAPNGIHSTPTPAAPAAVETLTSDVTPASETSSAQVITVTPAKAAAGVKNDTSIKPPVAAQAETPVVKLSWAERVAKNTPRAKSVVSTSSPMTPSPPPARIAPLPPLPDRRIRGLVNGGNTCFVNVILQALIACDPFRRFLLSCRNVKSNPPLLKRFVALAVDMTVSATSTPEPLPSTSSSSKTLPNVADPLLPDWCHDIFPSSLPDSSSAQRPTANGGISTGRRGGSQEDAQEFLTFLLNQLHEELLASESHAADVKANGFASVETGYKSRQVANNFAAGVEKGEGEWQEMNRRGRPVQVRGSTTSQSTITKIFGGGLRSELKRPRAKASITREPFLSLSLDIDSGMIRHVEDALAAYFQMEHVEGYTAEDSQEAVEAKKQVLLETLPPVLILHLKRFSHDSRTGALNKVSRRLDFPETLSIPASILHGSKTSQGANDRNYRLTSVVTHIGKELAGGHYLCDVRVGKGAKQVWAACDDSKVSSVNVQTVLRRQAYLLFYTRSCVGD